MKTLSEAVQVQIISEAGSTYRNVYLSLIRDGTNLENSQKVLDYCTTVSSAFIDMTVKKLK